MPRRAKEEVQKHELELWGQARERDGPPGRAKHRGHKMPRDSLTI